MTICKKPVNSDDHLQETGPYEWSFARGQSIGMIIVMVFVVESGELDEYGELELKKENCWLEEKINSDTNQPADRQGEYSAICLFKC